MTFFLELTPAQLLGLAAVQDSLDSLVSLEKEPDLNQRRQVWRSHNEGNSDAYRRAFSFIWGEREFYARIGYTKARPSCGIWEMHNDAMCPGKASVVETVDWADGDQTRYYCCTDHDSRQDYTWSGSGAKVQVRDLDLSAYRD